MPKTSISEQDDASIAVMSSSGIVSNAPRARAFRYLQEWIFEGRLAAGQRLPSENRLAAKLKVSRTTVRLALEDLEKVGMISSDRRCRMVMSHVRPAKTFLSETIVIIMDSPAKFNRKDIHGTWHSNFIHTGAIDAVRDAGYDAMTLHPSHITGDTIQRLIAERPRGIVIMRSVLQDKFGEHIAKAFKEGNIPFVVYGDLGLVYGDPQLNSEIDMVISDHEAGGYELAKWIIQQGRKRILRVSYFPFDNPEEIQPWVERRNKGYERAISEAGLELLPPVQIFDLNPRPLPKTQEEFDFMARLTAGYLLEYVTGPNPVDAIIAISDAIVAGVCGALRAYGKTPNREILVAGYDNMWDSREDINRWDPLGPAATVEKKNIELGKELVSILLQRIEGKIFEHGTRHVVAPELVVRPAAIPPR